MPTSGWLRSREGAWEKSFELGWGRASIDWEGYWLWEAFDYRCALKPSCEDRCEDCEPSLIFSGRSGSLKEAKKEVEDFFRDVGGK